MLFLRNMPNTLTEYISRHQLVQACSMFLINKNQNYHICIRHKSVQWDRVLTAYDTDAVVLKAQLTTSHILVGTRTSLEESKFQWLMTAFLFLTYTYTCDLYFHAFKQFCLDMIYRLVCCSTNENQRRLSHIINFMNIKIWKNVYISRVND